LPAGFPIDHWNLRPAARVTTLPHDARFPECHVKYPFRPLAAVPLMLLFGGCLNNGIADDKAAADAMAAEHLTTQPWHLAGTDTPGLAIFSDHYKICTTIRDPLYQHLLARVLEAAYARSQVLNAGTPVTPPGGVFECYVFGDRPQWELYTRLRMGPNAATYLQISAGGYAQQGVFAGYDISRDRTLSVIAHEAWHQYAYFAFKDRIPAWLDEGIATQNEHIDIDPTTGAVLGFSPEKNYARYQAVMAAMREQRLWKLPDLMATHAGKVVGMSQKYVDAYYGQLWALVLFMEHSDEYRPRLIAALKAAREGKLSAALAATVRPEEMAAASERWNAAAGGYMGALIEPDMARLEGKYRAFLEEISGGWPLKIR